MSLASWTSVGISLGLFGSCAAGWFLYLRWKDDGRPEALPLRLVATLLGFGSTGAAFLGYNAFTSVGLDVEWSALMHASLPRAVTLSLVIGLVEETAKMLPVVAFLLFSRRLVNLRDWLILAACAGLGFATAESMSLYLHGELTLTDAVARAIAAPIIHALFSAPWGLGLGALILLRRVLPLVAGMTTSIFAHGLYDLIIARPGVPTLLAALVVLGLWIWLIRTVARLARFRPKAHRAALPALPRAVPV
jgi:RsiW-degrading membrane proteinase PrsW (M82 family)